MDVAFRITFDHRRFYAEREVYAQDAALSAKVASTQDIHGAIVMTNDGQPVLEIIDELLPWVQNLCFDAVSRLARGDEARVNYFSRSGWLALKPVGDEIEVTGSLTPAAKYSKAAFLPALLACGERFERAMRVLKKDDVAFIANLDYMRTFAESARQSLD
ncbi:hypothetical protein [Pandoraea pulmonicola]|uniref:Uncharacterized protein n=1 Tax=Pandoraea pulmonicola TaxID=93221 RepID=A0AAJ4Z8K6_PANPU|nr:hypothetical protein [Pandoraea pulmonicola]AJC22308.1 hypothetical protein RO07_20720 [Pandoraea pulmonicola]SUA88606.1 Uncharacterised protein [Pandoraea pulmonicola]